MEPRPKVLIGTPTSNQKDYCFDDWYDNVKMFTYPEVDLLMVDNSIGEAYHKHLKSKGVNCVHVNPAGRHTQQYITESQNVIRNYFLDHPEYTHLFMLESDVFPPCYVIEQLLHHDLECVGAPYFIQSGMDSHLLLGIYVPGFSPETEVTGMVMRPTLSFIFMDGTLKLTSMQGVGCTMIKREVIEKIPFRSIEGHKNHADSFFYEDLFKAGYQNYSDTSLEIQHRNLDWNTVVDRFIDGTESGFKLTDKNLP